MPTKNPYQYNNNIIKQTLQTKIPNLPNKTSYQYNINTVTRKLQSKISEKQNDVQYSSKYGYYYGNMFDEYNNYC